MNLEIIKFGTGNPNTHVQAIPGWFYQDQTDNSLWFKSTGNQKVGWVQIGQGGPGTDLTDTSTQTIQSSEGSWRKLPTLSQGGTLTLGTTAAVKGDTIQITRTSVSANTYAIVNGGTGAGTLYTMIASKLGCAEFYFDGTDWSLKSFGDQT